MGKKISELTSLQSISGNEEVPLRNGSGNAKTTLSALAVYFGAGVQIFSEVATSGSGDQIIDDTYSGSGGTLVYLTNNNKFAIKVDNSGSYNYYLQFSGLSCHSGSPVANKTYLCLNPSPALWNVANGTFTQMTVPTVWLTEEQFEAAQDAGTLLEGVTYIIYEE